MILSRLLACIGLLGISIGTVYLLDYIWKRRKEKHYIWKEKKEV